MVNSPSLSFFLLLSEAVVMAFFLSLYRSILTNETLLANAHALFTFLRHCLSSALIEISQLFSTDITRVYFRVKQNLLSNG